MTYDEIIYALLRGKCTSTQSSFERAVDDEARALLEVPGSKYYKRDAGKAAREAAKEFYAADITEQLRAPRALDAQEIFNSRRFPTVWAVSEVLRTNGLVEGAGSNVYPCAEPGCKNEAGPACGTLKYCYDHEHKEVVQCSTGERREISELAPETQQRIAEAIKRYGLAVVLKEDGSPRIRNREKLLVQLADGVKRLHQSKVIHICVTFYASDVVVTQFFGLEIALDYLVNDICRDADNDWSEADRLEVDNY